MPQPLTNASGWYLYRVTSGPYRGCTFYQPNIAKARAYSRRHFDDGKVKRAKRG